MVSVELRWVDPVEGFAALSMLAAMPIVDRDRVTAKLYRKSMVTWGHSWWPDGTWPRVTRDEVATARGEVW